MYRECSYRALIVMAVSKNLLFRPKIEVLSKSRKVFISSLRLFRRGILKRRPASPFSLIASIFIIFL